MDADNSPPTTNSPQKPARTSRWLMALFGLPFAAAGLGLFGFLVAPTLIDWQHAKTWQPVQAELLAAELQSHSGDDSTTWEATAKYRYEYDGSTWEGDRVALSSGADNIGSFQQDLGNELAYTLARGDTVTVYVNPENPREAIINRELRVGLLLLMGVFSLVFAAVGLGVIGAAIFAGRSKTETVTSNLPKPPAWQTRKEWSEPVITSDTRVGSLGAWFFAFFWCALTIPANLFIQEEISKGNWAILVILLFDLVGILLLVWAVRSTWSSRKFGAVPLTMNPHPGSIGGDVGGYIDIPVAHDPSLAFHVALTCTRSYVTGSGKNRSTMHEAKWHDEKWLLAEPFSSEHVRLWFRFEPPADLPESEIPSDNYHHWGLQLTASLPGLDLARHYDLPVFATATRSSGALATRVQVSMAQDLAVIEERTHFRQIPGGAAMEFRAGRQWLAGLVAMFAVGGIFGGVGIAVLLSAEDPETIFFLGGIFSLIGAAGVVTGLWYLGNRLSVEADDSGLRIRRWLFGIPVKHLDCARADITGIGIVRGSTTTIGTRTIVHYELALKTNDEKIHGIGDGFRGTTQASMAAETFTRYTRLPFLGEIDKSEAFAARKAAYLARRNKS